MVLEKFAFLRNIEREELDVQTDACHKEQILNDIQSCHIGILEHKHHDCKRREKPCHQELLRETAFQDAAFFHAFFLAHDHVVENPKVQNKSNNRNQGEYDGTDRREIRFRQNA